MKEKLCEICKVPSERTCSACGSVVYCSLDHQKQDWKIHKQNCVLYKVCKNPKLGRYVTATRNFGEGTVILTEEPIVLGPKLYSLPICLGCYVRVDGTYFCSKCGFPLCSLDCENVPAHRNNECKIFSVKGSSPKKILNYDIPHPLYQSILPLRCLLLRDNNPEKWNLLMEMEHHTEIRKCTSEVWNEQQVNIVNFLRDWHGLKKDYTEEVVNRVIGFIEVNSFQIKTVKKIEICGLFKMGAMMSHDCTPNTHHAFREDGNLVLRSSVKIKKDSIISMSYVDVLSGTIERRHMLKQSKYFPCDCNRCSDPTELGTFISGVKCSCNREGYLLPENPLIESPWVCYQESNRKRNPNCNIILSPKDIENKLKNLTDEIGSPDSEFNIDNLKNRIATYSNNFLHPNHFLLLSLWKHLNHLYIETQQEVNEITQLNEHKKVIEKLLVIVNVLDPGLTRERGLLLHQLYKVRNKIAEIEYKDKDPSAYTTELEKLKILKMELQKLFDLDIMIGVKPV